MSLFKRKKAGEEANTIPEAMDDITQTLLIPVKDEGEKTMCADAYETSQAEIASYTSIGTCWNTLRRKIFLRRWDAQHYD